MNMMRTAVLIAALTALFMGVGYLVGGVGRHDDRLRDRRRHECLQLLERRQDGAVDVWRPRGRRTHRAGVLRHRPRLAARAGLPMPKVYIIDTPQPNAFATGRNPQNAAVAASTGLLQTPDADEVAGVMAHELAHVKNHDTLTMTITATIAGAVSMLANFAFFFGGRRDERQSVRCRLARSRQRCWRRSPRCWCRWRSAGRANMRPTGWAREISGSAALARLGAFQDRRWRGACAQ